MRRLGRILGLLLLLVVVAFIADQVAWRHRGYHVTTIEGRNELVQCGHTVLPFPSSEGIILPCWIEERRQR